MSAQPITLHLREGVRKQMLTAGYIRPLLRNDGKDGPIDLDAVTLPSYGSILGEVKR